MSKCRDSCIGRRISFVMNAANVAKVSINHKNRQNRWKYFSAILDFCMQDHELGKVENHASSRMRRKECTAQQKAQSRQCNHPSSCTVFFKRDNSLIDNHHDHMTLDGALEVTDETRRV